MIRDLKHYARVPRPSGNGGPAPLETDDDMERWWSMMLDAIRQRTGREIELKPHAARPKAYVNHGRWVADCPECSGGIDCSPDLPRGACLDCGAVYKIDFPSKKEREDVDALLSERPREANRNWDRHKGEELKLLRTENRLLLKGGEQ